MSSPDHIDRLTNLAHRLRHSQLARLAFLLSADVVLVFLAYYASFWLRLDAAAFFADWGSYHSLFWRSAPWLIALRLVCNWLGRQYAWSFGHAGLQEAGRLVFSISGATLIFVAINEIWRPFGLTPPRSVYVLEMLLSLTFAGILRFLPKYLYVYYCQHQARAKTDGEVPPTLVYGAGGNAELLVRELLRTIGHPYKLVGFIDDSASKRHVFICGLKVLGRVEELPELIVKHNIRQILVTIPNFSGAPLRKMLDICSPFNIKYKIVQPYQKVLSQSRLGASISQIKPEFLINRPAVPFQASRLADFYRGKTALVTGAAGSIGSEICSLLASSEIGRLVLFDVNETGIFFVYHDLIKKYPALAIDFEIGSVQNEHLINSVMAKYKPSVVLHAAAYKHVSMMEFCPEEALRNNVLGTYFTARAAAASGAADFLMISSDKAIAPAGVMGATKRLAEMVLRNLPADSMRRTIVRFGNVLGSNGSLLQIIERQIGQGGPVTVTSPEMVRYFMTIPEAIGLVLTTPALPRSKFFRSGTFMLDMGEGINIDQLVRQVISLSGLVPDRDIEIVYTQKRPGEKITEALTGLNEVLEPTEHPGIWFVNHRDRLIDLPGLINELTLLTKAHDAGDRARSFIGGYVPDYQPRP